MERVWELTQHPELHPRWDARFTAIRPSGTRDDGAELFDYELDLGVHTIRGAGVSLGERRSASGTRTSALLFSTADPLSPLGEGRGYWRYTQEECGVRFVTGYDYVPGWGPVGRVLDPLITRRLVWWLTAWSFDRLRLWAESGIEPERVGWFRGWFGGPRARARVCRSRPDRGAAVRPGRGSGTPGADGLLRTPAAPRIMDDAPDTLEQIANHGARTE